MPRDIFYENILRPLLFSQEPETVHHFVSSSMVTFAPLLPMLPYRYEGEDLKLEFFGKSLQNPIGLAAGFDKNGSLLSMIGKLGFGFAEIGSVCARPHGGNDRPRLFRLPEDQAVINRLGLNGLGAETVSRRLRGTSTSLPYAVNIAKTNNPSITGKAAIDDYVYTFSLVADLPLAFVVLNVSCPNTREGCVKETDLIGTVLNEISNINKGAVPILLKLSPDTSNEFLQELFSIANSSLVQGFVCGNTSLRRDNLKSVAEKLEAIGAGGLSGLPLKALNLGLTRKVNRMKSPMQKIIGVGGISSGQDAYDYIRAGASVVESYTGMIYRGPSMARQICEELSVLLARDRVSLAQATGIDG